MKTLLLSEIFPPRHGGSGRWFWELYSRLPKDEYVLAVGVADGANEFDESNELAIERVNLSSPEWGIKSLTGLKYYWRTYWQLRKLIKKHGIKVLHCGRCLPEGFMGLLLKFTLGVRYICYVHGEDIESAAQSRELSALNKLLLKHTDLVICNSENSARLLENWQVPKEKVTVLNPGVDTHYFVPSESDAKDRESLGWGDKKVILTVGRLQKRKGHDKLIEAMPKILQSEPNTHYAIIGNGEEMPYLTSLVDSLNLHDHVTFMSEIDDQTMLSCYQNCDLFVLPNRQVGRDIEGFGMVLIEAQSCEKPVIAGDSGGTRETMMIGESGHIIDCTDAENLAGSIIATLADQNKLAEMGKVGRQFVVDNFDWGVHVTKAKKGFEVVNLR